MHAVIDLRQSLLRLGVLLALLTIHIPVFACQPSHLTPNDIEKLLGPVTFDLIEARWGPYLEADRYAIGYPKHIHTHLTPEEQWKRAYWLFYERDNEGRPITPLTLTVIASLPHHINDVSAPWVDLLPHMTIDWPVALQGRPVMSVLLHK